MTMKHKVCELTDIEDGGKKCLTVDGRNLLLSRDGEKVSAFDNRCPHLGLSMSRAKVEGDALVCPWHGSRFDRMSGDNTDWVQGVASITLPRWSQKVIALGKEPEGLTQHRCEVIENAVWVYFERE